MLAIGHARRRTYIGKTSFAGYAEIQGHGQLHIPGMYQVLLVRVEMVLSACLLYHS